MQTVAAEQKIKGGKLVRVRIIHDGSIVFQVIITGDFFVHPEEGLDSIERSLIGLKVPTSSEKVEKVVNGIVSSESIKLIGFSTTDLAKLVAGVLI
jgi:lipoate-protein ligase A